MALSSYFDFAENDFQYFKASYEAGTVANMMGAMAQGIVLLSFCLMFLSSLIIIKRKKGAAYADI